MPQVLTDRLKDVAELIKTKADKHHILRQPLQMRKQKPVAIKMLNPKFEENFVKGRDYDPDREQAERRKMKKLLKQEAKGAIRELRKDNSFLYEVKARDKALMEEEKAEKYGKVRLFLQEQEHAMKSGQLGKGKGKKRRR
ncbi:probable nucleolar complex protein 14 [Pyrus x bretschneideri]|uniref:probable nucleolar complex protein 14 n=1 Tax=Pyrus x bretschneideri TaxID=225117 RepID=UPI00087073B0|nr:probable nucleolar complex protein 14 [Pyrus x bretschneideri]